VELTEIAYDVEDRVAMITLDRPQALNAFTPTMCRELLDAFDRVDADDSVRAVIVTGRGRGFCAGADLSSGGATFDQGAQASEGRPGTGDDRPHLEQARPGPGDGQPRPDQARPGPGDGGPDSGDDRAGGDAEEPAAEDAERRGGGGGHVPRGSVPPAPRRDGGGLVSLRIFDCTKPVIAAINGPAVGVGVTMTLPMDIRLASASARFGFVFARRGIVPEACSSWFLPRVVGISQAAEWVYTGRVFEAGEAMAAGLVRSVHPADELLGAARALADEIASSTSAVSVALARRMLWRMLGASHPMEAHRADSRGVFSTGQSEDALEGVTSFLEKRPAVFPGRVSTDLPDLFPDWQQPQFR